ncbi:flavin monoamine oxidase family protein [Litoreibacter albidus]|uniref:Monoamine oxidase n=1 Tax=Litoreibacter albidus TaxID=670155 RepID=A0A1H3BQD7_9RHOB|nr:FAD-dependent oxidoreductase [Litoreibacter albidus]SDX44096.1 monoamine oxidase [Litoreibacter albidus]
MLDLVIVGGGLSGLALARIAQSRGLTYKLLEARDRFGGRIDGIDGVDLGPSWFWPSHSRMAALVKKLNLTAFEQWSTGDALFEDRTTVQRGQGFASMAGTYRIAGGMSAVVEALVAKLDRSSLLLNAPVQTITQEDGVIVTTRDGTDYAAHHVVLAVPPRVAANMVFSPPLPVAAAQPLSGIPGWMAGQAKLVATYPTPFWREDGLSGDAVSQAGPMVEIHDASDPDSGKGAIFGFVGVPAPHRDGEHERILAAGLEQMTRLFGAKAATPEQLILKDWAQEPFTATRPDWDFNGPHPRYGCPPELRSLWDGVLLLGSTEFAATQGGFLEGALERAEEIAAILSK